MRRKRIGFVIALLWYSIMIAGVFYFVGYKVAYSRMESSASTLTAQTFYATISDIQNNIFTVTGMEVNDINFRGRFCFPKIRDRFLTKKGFNEDALHKAVNPYFTEEPDYSEHFGLGLYNVSCSKEKYFKGASSSSGIK